MLLRSQNTEGFNRFFNERNLTIDLFSNTSTFFVNVCIPYWKIGLKSALDLQGHFKETPGFLYYVLMDVRIFENLLTTEHDSPPTSLDSSNFFSSFINLGQLCRKKIRYPWKTAGTPIFSYVFFGHKIFHCSFNKTKFNIEFFGLWNFLWICSPLSSWKQGIWLKPIWVEIKDALQLITHYILVAARDMLWWVISAKIWNRSNLNFLISLEVFQIRDAAGFPSRSYYVMTLFVTKLSPQA